MAKLITNSTPKADGFRMPGEFEEQKQIFMIWPERTDNWRAGAKPAIRCKVSATHEICVVLTFFYALFFPSQRISSHPFSWSVSKVDALRYGKD